MVDIIHRIGIKAPIDQIYAAVSTIDGLAGWWTEDTTGTSKVGENINFTFKTLDGQLKGEITMKVVALDKNKSVRWKCLSGPNEWIDTEITFDLSKQDDQIILIFGHRKWKEAVEFTAHCSMKWAIFLLSLKDLVHAGKGQPSPLDVKIDNWN